MFDSQVQSVIDRVDQLRDQVDDHWQIPRAEALVLAQLVRIGRCRSLCEIGTSYGFSALHLAAATREQGGHLHTIDMSDKKHKAAGRHLADAGLRDTVTLHHGDARLVLKTLRPAEPFDFVFIDAVKFQSIAYLDAVRPLLAPRAVLVTDNTGTHADELADFVEQVRQCDGVRSCDVAVGNGFELSLWVKT